MDTAKSKYIEQSIDELLKFWFGIAALLGSIFFLSLGIMDYFSTPENFRLFMVYRVVVCFLLITLFFINRKISSKYRLVLFTLSIIFSATAIELMILSFGGHTSTYYAGLIILIV